MCRIHSNDNKAIRRPGYAIPTIEEKLPLLKNAKLFTIVNVSDAFHTIEFNDESALLTTFMGRWPILLQANAVWHLFGT